MTRIIGIDLGTTNSCVAVASRKSSVNVLSTEHGERTIPSIVAFTDTEILVGEAAKRQGVTNTGRTIFGSKRLIGRKVNDPAVTWFANTAPFEIAAAKNGDAWIRIGDKLKPPQEVSAHILTRMRELAETSLGEPVTKAVVTVPAYFNEAQRQATRDAGTIAGLDIIRLVNEPTAAALAFGAHRTKEGRRVISVFDLGGGTFDVSIMAVENGIFEVLATSGDMNLGGDDWDARIMHRLAEELYADHKVDVLAEPLGQARLREAAQVAKHNLTTEKRTTISLQFLARDAEENPVHLDRDMTREEFESLTSDLLKRLADPCKQALSDAGLTASGIEDVLLVGGMSRSPAVQRRVAEIFECTPSKGANPDEIVAVGAAAHALIIGGSEDDAALLDVTPQAIGVKTGAKSFSEIVPRNSMLPVRRSKMFATSRDNQKFFKVELYQGDSDDVSENKKLGEIVLDDLPPGPAGTTKVELTLTVDVESIIDVTAKELNTGRATTVKLSPSGGLTERDMDELIGEQRALAEIRADEKT